MIGLFDTASQIPHGFYLLWNPALLRTWVSANVNKHPPEI
jgi:hypothetical protein